MKYFQTQFEKHICELRKKLKEELADHVFKGSYKVVWEEFEDIIEPVLVAFLINIVPGLNKKDIIKAKDKNTYPDFEIRYHGELNAIDIKSGQDEKSPAYDIGRLETYERSHLHKYASEYCITVRWKPIDKAVKVVDVYVEPTYASVGLNPKCNGLKYRRKDGNLRPKSWSSFEAQKNHWQDLDDFRLGLERSKKYLRLQFLKDWYGKMDKADRKMVRDIINEIDQTDR